MSGFKKKQITSCRKTGAGLVGPPESDVFMQSDVSHTTFEFPRQQAAAIVAGGIVHDNDLEIHSRRFIKYGFHCIRKQAGRFIVYYND